MLVSTEAFVPQRTLPVVYRGALFSARASRGNLSVMYISFVGSLRSKTSLNTRKSQHSTDGSVLVLHVMSRVAGDVDDNRSLALKDDLHLFVQYFVTPQIKTESSIFGRTRLSLMLHAGES